MSGKRTDPASNIEILAYESTPLGPLCLRRRRLLSEPGTVVTEITLNHEYLMSSRHTDSERALAGIPLSMHSGSDLSVLIGGLGLGYTAAEVLRDDRVRRVDVVEYLPQVTSWLEQGLIPLAETLNADERFRVTTGDIYGRLAGEQAASHDLILIDVDHSPDDRLGEQSAAFYARAGLEQAAAHLAPGGILAVWSYAESSPFASDLRQVFGQVRVKPIRFFNTHVGEEQTDWLFLARNPEPGPTEGAPGR